jgi:integrase
MLSVYTRHYPPCDHTDIHHRRCRCPKWIQGLLEGKGFVRTSARTRSWEKAELRVRKMECPDNPVARQDQPITLQKAIAEFVSDEEARKVGAESLRKTRALLERGFASWCKTRKLHLIKQIGPAELREFRSSWNNSATTTQRKHELLRSFFAFCMSNEWLGKNPMDALKKPIAHRGKPTDYFTREEFSKILEATYEYEFGGGNDCRSRKDRLRALVLLMRWSGLSIKDAVTLERARIDQKGSLLLRRAKTGVPVFVPLPPEVSSALRSLPSDNPRYFFWSGNGDPKSAIKAYQRSFWKLFNLADIKHPDESRKRCHPHMFRDTFAVELLLAGVPIDQVSVLLAHSSVKITEKHYAPWVKARQEQMEANVQRAWFGAAIGELTAPSAIKGIQ